MKYAVEMGLGAMIYIPSITKIGSAIQQLVGGMHRHIAWRSHKPTFIFQNKESRLNILKLSLTVNLFQFKYIRFKILYFCVVP
jgi:hypothetical protein